MPQIVVSVNVPSIGIISDMPSFDEVKRPRSSKQQRDIIDAIERENNKISDAIEMENKISEAIVEEASSSMSKTKSEDSSSKFCQEEKEGEEEQQQELLDCILIVRAGDYFSVDTEGVEITYEQAAITYCLSYSKDNGCDGFEEEKEEEKCEDPLEVAVTTIEEKTEEEEQAAAEVDTAEIVDPVEEETTEVIDTVEEETAEVFDTVEGETAEVATDTADSVEGEITEVADTVEEETAEVANTVEEETAEVPANTVEEETAEVTDTVEENVIEVADTVEKEEIVEVADAVEEEIIKEETERINEKAEEQQKEQEAEAEEIPSGPTTDDTGSIDYQDDIEFALRGARESIDTEDQNPQGSAAQDDRYQQRLDEKEEESSQALALESTNNNAPSSMMTNSATTEETKNRSDSEESSVPQVTVGDDKDECEEHPQQDEDAHQLELGFWAKKTMKAFGINTVPTNWLSSPGLLEQCSLQDERLWQQYYQSRRLLDRACHEEPVGPVDEPSSIYKQELKAELEKAWDATVLGAVLLKHTRQRAAGVAMQDGKLQAATIVSTILSPYLLPRGVQLCHRYKREGEQFWCTWHIQFVDLKEPAKTLMSYWRPGLDDMWELCSNANLKMPTTETGWMEVQDIETSFFTPSMVRKIRKWLFGHYDSYHLFNDLDLIRYVLGSCGAVNNFATLHGDIGHTWKASPNQAKDMQTYGTLEDSEVSCATNGGTNWLEFQSRLVTASVRSIDQWYEPYDQKYYKGQWGEKVLDHRVQTHGHHLEEDDVVRSSPWKIWDRSVHGIGCP